MVIIASATLIVINYYTLKITSAVRAYINGESEYSKGQKDGVLYLLTYIQTSDQLYWKLYKQELNIPESDNNARTELLKNENTQSIKRLLLMGENHPDDLDDMIWLFKTFGSIKFMKESIRLWGEGEMLVNEIAAIGEAANKKILENNLTAEDKVQMIQQINSITMEFTKRETAFSDNLGASARGIHNYLFLANVIFIIIILGVLITYAITMFHRLAVSQNELKIKNADLTNINHELDTFIYSVSHDLRAPITSIKGLISIASLEENTGNIPQYLKLMDNIVEKQDKFIKDILDFFKNKRTSVKMEKLSLAKIIDESVTFNRYLAWKQGINIKKEKEQMDHD